MLDSSSIKKYLKPFKITGRTSTFVGAFANALAPHEEYDAEVVTKAVRRLGLNPEKLRCIYCGAEAATWDHLVSIVKERELRGYGHQVGNLVPACRTCNEKKGAKDFEVFLRSLPTRVSKAKVQKLKEHLKRNAKILDISKSRRAHPELWREYEGLRRRALSILKRADKVAEKIRKTL